MQSLEGLRNLLGTQQLFPQIPKWLLIRPGSHTTRHFGQVEHDWMVKPDHIRHGSNRRREREQQPEEKGLANASVFVGE